MKKLLSVNLVSFVNRQAIPVYALNGFSVFSTDCFYVTTVEELYCSSVNDCTCSMSGSEHINLCVEYIDE